MAMTAANYLANLTPDQVRFQIARAQRAEQIHAAGGRFYMAELCGKRAEELQSLLTQKVAA